MKAENLHTEYLINPIGIDIKRPKLFWNCMDGIKQSAYQIAACNEAGVSLWNSGKIASSQMTHITYKGDLESRQRVVWKVRLWDENDSEGPWSEEAFFEMGLLAKTDWTAKWIAGNYKVDKKKRYPVDCFKKTLTCEKEVKKARLYITACGLYEAAVNGIRAGDFVLAPGHTDYTKRIQYQTYDVTEQLVQGENVIEVQLADGWYRGSCGAWGLVNQYGTQTKFITQLEVEYVNGQKDIIISDDRWQWSNDGPIRFADNQDGEVVEASHVPGFCQNAKVVSCDVVPTASNNVSVKEHETFQAEKIVSPSGKMVLDFGQNIAGYIQFHFEAKQGQTIKLRFGEMLDKQGEFTQKNIQCAGKKKTSPLQQVIYTCKDGENDYKTKFAIFGFQYVLVETDVDVEPDDFTAIAVYSDLETTLHFDSSNKLLNKLVENTLWSTKNNSCDVPTDCPTRERLDGQVIVNCLQIQQDI